jgi:outer membrane protein assembly factor BamB
MRTLTLLFVVAVTATSPFALAEDAPDKLPLEAPESWGGETIRLPPPFAPDMKLSGVEEIRFAPGMFKPDSESFFSYVFVFRVPASIELTLDVLEREMLVYYRGLAKAVMRGKGAEFDKFEFDLEELVVGDRLARTPSGVTPYSGSIDWVEPFVTKESQRLYIEMDVWKAKSTEHRYIFCSVSPKQPDGAPWKDLRKVRDRFVQTVMPQAASPRPPALSRWPSFRGAGASGVSDRQNLPSDWNLDDGTYRRWVTSIPGLAHSSPIVWDGKLFVTSAITGEKSASFRPGLYGAGDASKDLSSHRWMLYCLDRKTGKILWERVAVNGKPKEKRHVKATYANSTPATDGKHVVAFFGSQGIYAYNVDGERLWSKDLGRLDVGAYDAPDYEWGTASSPILHDGLVFVQCDTQKESFLIALDVETGKVVWKKERDELPSWGTPTVCRGPKGDELVTNASNFIRAYDPKSGDELWRLGGSSKITAPTPIISEGLIVVASGRHPEAPIFVVRSGSRGDLTLKKGKTLSEHIVWSRQKRGSYMPTPIIYRGLLYVLGNSGILDCYDFKTGEEVYRKRIKHAGSGFSASPVASDGRILLSSEDGSIFFVKAGREFKVLSKTSVGETVMATPAIAGGTLYVRTRSKVYAFGR